MMQAVKQEVSRLSIGLEDVQQSVETILEKLQSYNGQPPTTNNISDCGCKAQIKVVLERMDQFEAEKIQMQAALTDITKKMIVLNRVRDSDIEVRVTTPKVMHNKLFQDKPTHISRESQCQDKKRESSSQTQGLTDESYNRSETFNQATNVEGAHKLDIKTDSDETPSKTKDKTELKHKSQERESSSKQETRRSKKKTEADRTGNQASSNEVVLYNKARSPRQNVPVVSGQTGMTPDKDQSALVLRTPNTICVVEEDGEEKEEAPVTVVHQTDKHHYSALDFWSLLSDMEIRDAKQSGWKDLHGAHSVICVDISESMSAAGAWKQVRTFFKDYIDGLERSRVEHDMKEEHVALVTFGNQTKVIQRLTNDLRQVKEAFDAIKLGGPSPMYGGTIMAYAAVESSDIRAILLQGNDVQINSKIIFITDGHPTEGTLCQGPDEVDPDLEDETKSKILLVMDSLQRLPVDIYCVPVGDNANKEFLQSIVDVGDGRMLEYTDGTKLSRRLYLSCNVDPLSFGLFGRWFAGLPGLHGDRHNQFSPEDRQHMMEIWDDDRKTRHKNAERRRAIEANYYGESNNEVLLPVGTRVRRGPDWRYKDADSNGPGTVIGHQLNVDQVNVEWDLPKMRGPYNYGEGGNYDVIAVDEPRILTQGQTIAVGCLVKPGQRRNLGVSRDIKGSLEYRKERHVFVW